MTHAQENRSPQIIRNVFLSLSAIFLLISSYLFGLYSYPRNVWPVELLRELKNKAIPPPPIDIATASLAIGKYDAYGRLIDFPGKKQVICPTQTKGVAVLLAFGQSNSANSSPHKFTTKYPDRVLNYYDGKCYVAASPLLGATGEGGEFITPLADKLIQDGTYKSVIIISSGIDGSPISRWQKDGDLNEMLLATLGKLRATYKITDIIWHQGESDFKNSTSTKVYTNSFRSLISTLEDVNITAPVFVSISTKCGPNPHWILDNPTATAQKRLIDEENIFLGANTDMLLEKEDRSQDDCHFSESGLLKTALVYAKAVSKTHK